VNIAFVSGNPHMPQVMGGVEVNTHALAAELIRRGNNVSVLAKLSLRNGFGLWRAARIAASGRKVWVDRELGYPVFRCRRPSEHTESLPRPAIAVVQNGAMLDLAAGFARIAVPAVAYLHGLGFESWPAEVAGLPFRGYIANSHFTAERFRRRFGLNPVIVPPLFRRCDYATAVTGSRVTFINPVSEKGVDLALQIAGLCPQIPFAFVLGWPLPFGAEARLRREIRRLGNIVLRQRTTDMRAIYRDTRILLAPSQWDAETWGRVVTEAQFSGIPVVTSDRGGLPEAAGPGGIVLPHRSPATHWAHVIAELWSNEEHYVRLSEAAYHHSGRSDIDPDRQVSALLDTLHGLAASPAGSGPTPLC
jgi:glycosyltransferase involved in cell wall biosynthesis